MRYFFDPCFIFPKIAMSRCKMVVSTIGMPGRFDLVGTRYYEVLSLGTSLLLVERAGDVVKEEESSNATINSLSSSHLAYSGVLQHLIQEDQTVIMFSSVSEFIQKVLLYKKRHREDVRSMLRPGQKLVQESHTWEARANLIVQSIQKQLHPHT